MQNTSTLPMLMFTFGLLFLVISFVEYFFPSKSRNQKGYRTKKALYSQETWDFAQKYYAKMLFRCSLLLIVLSFIATFMTFSDTLAIVTFFITILLLSFFIYYKTENALKKKFDF
ncbi:SdpI family protein [Flavobacterium paronense]|uniref:SdpI family protein n=1 Tax=Flavobacterium paronense TaxID=1392775 RepID=A0ABV5GEE1_9FLAO|nr:SdpI family protein [Flavobacterium paronense]MDN3678284.1 SdpI family protein [Flavobacterium paronense]